MVISIEFMKRPTITKTIATLNLVDIPPAPLPPSNALFINMYVCMYAHAYYVCMYLHTHTYILCMYVFIYIYKNVCE